MAHGSTEPPIAAGVYPDAIHLWFPPQSGKAFLLCSQGWVEWVKGRAIKDVCTTLLT